MNGREKSIVWQGWTIYPALKIGLNSIQGPLLRLDFIEISTAFLSDTDIGLSDIFEYARNTATKGHPYKLSIALCPLL